MHQEFSVTIPPLTAPVSAQGVPPLIGDRYQQEDETAEPPIDLPLHDAAPAAVEAPPLFRQMSEAPAESGRGIGIALGMLVIGLLAGFGGGFVAGQRLTPPALPPAVKIPPPLQAAPPPVVENVIPSVPAPVPAPEPPVLPARNSTEAAVRATGPALGEIALVSRPPGATVYVDDVRAGVTPMTMKNVTPGIHRIRLELFGHKTWVTSVTVEPSAQARVGASMEE